MSSSAATATQGLQEDGGVGVGVPILWRLNRLDNILKHLEDIKTATRDTESPRTPSSYASTNSTATTTFSGDISPEKHLPNCRPVDEVLMEVQQKGTLIQRLIHVEDRIFKLCLQMEEESGSETRSKELEATWKDEDSHKKGGLKKMIKSCVKGGGKKKAKATKTTTRGRCSFQFRSSNLDFVKFDNSVNVLSLFF